MIEPADSLFSATRRAVLRGGAATLAALGLSAAGFAANRSPQGATGKHKRFPAAFIWGAATSGHQVEGNDVDSDTWYMEQLQPTLFAERAGDATNGFELWPSDLDLVRSLNLNAYRFSIEWSRIEPDPGHFSLVMLEHYLRIIEGCRARNLQPIVTFNHFSTPRWFAARGGWTNSESPALFERFCERAARHLAHSMAYATTLNDPTRCPVCSGVPGPPAMK